MLANEWLQAGKLSEAIQELSEQVRKHPLDASLRAALFEALCFAGEYDRCEKQLDVLAQGGKTAELGALFYRAVLRAEKTRQQFFAGKEYLNQPQAGPMRAGRLNGSAFQGIGDMDSRIGPRLEVFLAGAYMWVPFEHVTSITVQPPKRLRDLMWAPALVRTAESFKGADLGEVLLPVLSPGSWRHADDQVRMGRVTVWDQQDDGEEVLLGQKMFVVDGQEVPILELRNLELEVVAAA
jgi:type VI secretion system protein ImpE